MIQYQIAYPPEIEDKVREWWDKHTPEGVALGDGVRGTIDGREVIWHAHQFRGSTISSHAWAWSNLGIIHGDRLAFEPPREESDGSI